MSDDVFAPSESASLTADDDRELTSFTKGVAITAIVLGALGLVGVCFGGTSLVAMMGNIDALAQTQPLALRDEYRALLESTQDLLPLSGVMLLLTVACCLIQVFGGIQALRKVGTGILAIAALAAGATDVLVLVVNVFTTWWQWPAQQAFMEAAQQLPGPAAAGAAGGVFGGMVGIAFNVLIYGGLAGFWLYAFTRVRKGG